MEIGLSYDQKFIAQTIPDKIFEIKQRNAVNLNMTFKFQLVNATLNMRAYQNKGQF